LTLDIVPVVEIHSEIDEISKCFDVNFHNLSKLDSCHLWLIFSFFINLMEMFPIFNVTLIYFWYFHKIGVTFLEFFFALLIYFQWLFQEVIIIVIVILNWDFKIFGECTIVSFVKFRINLQCLLNLRRVIIAGLSNFNEFAVSSFQDFLLVFFINWFH